jgi:hypothetical protein
MEVHRLESLYVFFIRRLPELFELLLNKVHLLATVAIAARVNRSLALLGSGCRLLREQLG